MKTLTSYDKFNEFVGCNGICLVYFSTPDCNVCKVLKPKLINFIKTEFPKISMAYINTQELKEIAAQNRIFTVPSILIYIEGKELIRKSRNLSLFDLKNELMRPYSLIF